MKHSMKIPFDKKIGVIGGGQLGKMLVESSTPWNLSYNILDADRNAPCKHYAEQFIHSSLMSDEGIRELASISDVLTYEIEHVNTETLIALEKEGKRIVPAPSVLAVIQDKGLQKNFYSENGLPTSAYKLINEMMEVQTVLEFFKEDKVVLKLRKGGYDGKGVAICSKKELEQGIFPFEGPCVVEAFIEGAIEVSILVASDGKETQTWPSVEMEFDPVLNLVDFTYSPGKLAPSVEEEISKVAINAVMAFKSPGIFAVELFISKNGDVLINEIAPRPHNSGHHTIEASYTSQYEQLNRILLGLPLGKTDLLKPAVMVNLIGPDHFTGDYQILGLDEVLKIEGFYVHLYKKMESKPGRKMGHFTVLGDTLEEAIEKARKIKSILKIVSK